MVIWFHTWRSFLNTKISKHSDVKLTVHLHSAHIQCKLYKSMYIWGLWYHHTTIFKFPFYVNLKCINELFKIDWKGKVVARCFMEIEWYLRCDEFIRSLKKYETISCQSLFREFLFLWIVRELHLITSRHFPGNLWPFEGCRDYENI